MYIANVSKAYEEQNTAKTAKQNLMSKENLTKEIEQEQERVILDISDEASYLYEMMDSIKEQKEAIAGMGDVFSKCLTISRRIGSGDNVPMKDHQFLIEHNPELYQQAMNMRILKDDPEDHDSIIEDEENETKNLVSASPSSIESVQSIEGGGEIAVEGV